MKEEGDGTPDKLWLFILHSVQSKSTSTSSRRLALPSLPVLLLPLAVYAMPNGSCQADSVVEWSAACIVQ